MARGRFGAGLTTLAVMAVLGGTACGRYGPPVRTPDAVPVSESATPDTAGAQFPGDSGSDDDTNSPRSEPTEDDPASAASPLIPPSSATPSP